MSEPPILPTYSTKHWDGRVFYGARCVFWTDDWSIMRTTDGGIPCCPRCGNVGFESSFSDWIKGIRQYAVTKDPLYFAFQIWLKGRCFKTIEQARAAYDAVKQP